VKPPQVIVSEVSPNGNIEAVIEQDDRVAYFYLHGLEDSEFGTRSCWVRNFAAAPKELDVRGMEKGVPPMLPRAHCRHPEGAPRLAPERPQLVWFEEGNAAALLEDNNVLAVIPGWSGHDGFEGYARDCIGESPLCWELGPPKDKAIFARIEAARGFWGSWKSGDDPWPQIQENAIKAYTSIGEHSTYYAIDRGKWPPRGMLRIPTKDGTVLVTLGISIRPLPEVEMLFEDPRNYRRIELGICLARDHTEKEIMDIAVAMSIFAAFPWSEYTWLGEGHTIECPPILTGPGGVQFTAVLLTENPPGAPTVKLPAYRGDPVRLLWLIPITQSEREFAIANGSKELTKLLWASGAGWSHRPRKTIDGVPHGK